MSTHDEKNPSIKANVVDLGLFKQKHKTTEDLGRGRKPLYVSHLSGKITGAPTEQDATQTPSQAKPQDFADRLVRIRASLEKMNKLLAELKLLSENNAPVSIAARRQSSDRR